MTENVEITDWGGIWEKVGNEIDVRRGIMKIRKGIVDEDMK